MSSLLAQQALANEQLWWFVARAGGIVALVLAGLSVMWGLLLSTKIMQGAAKPKWLLSLHKFLGGLTVTFTAVHVAALVADSYVEFGWLEILVPFASTWKPTEVALGVVAMYLLAAVEITSLLMKHIPRRWWRLIHLSSYLLFWLGLIHGVTAGSDASHPLYVLGTATMTVLVLFLTIYRIVTARRHNSSARQHRVRSTEPGSREIEPEKPMVVTDANSGG